MTVTDFTVLERPGERTKAMPNGLRVNMTRDYAVDLVRRLTEQLGDEQKGEVEVAMFGEVVEA